jgi:hypothetical protein
MKNQPELITKMQEKVEEIRLAQEVSQQVELAVDYAKYKKNAVGIKLIIKQVTGFEYDMDPLEDIPEIVAAINSLKAFEKKVASAKG